MSSRGGGRVSKRTRLQRSPIAGIDDGETNKLRRRSTRIQNVERKKNKSSVTATVTTVVDNVTTSTSTELNESDNAIAVVIGDSSFGKVTVEIDATFQNFSRMTQVIEDDEDVIEINDSRPDLVVLDESDVEEIPAYHLPDELLPPDISQPSTSYATNSNTRSMDGEVMEQFGEQKEQHNLKKLQDFQKETEELLKTTAASLQEFNPNRPKEPAKKTKAPEEEQGKSAIFTKTCPICLDPLFSQPTVSTVCGHIYCEDCIKPVIQQSKKCPTCRKGLTLKKIHPIYL